MLVCSGVRKICIIVRRKKIEDRNGVTYSGVKEQSKTTFLQRGISHNTTSLHISPPRAFVCNLDNF